ncbi:MAG TPA: L,D-transpeptidase [Pyrinomonadaceae bacterium]
MHRYSIVIRKRDRTLELFDSNTRVKSYAVVLGFAPEGDKEREGDGKTPQGEFYIFVKNPQSRFHLSLGISYPAAQDAEHGLAAGMISQEERDAIVFAIDNQQMPLQKTALGGEIYIHGGGTDGDWTRGCIAMSNEDIEELYNTVPVGTRVFIIK